jgi:hypothetical protein
MFAKIFLLFLLSSKLFLICGLKSEMSNKLFKNFGHFLIVVPKIVKEDLLNILEK